MPKRFTDTNIWKSQRWFRKLNPYYKLAFSYIKDQCDHAGIWKIDCADLMEDLGIDDFNMDDFIEKCNTEFDKTSGKKMEKVRIVNLKNKVLWLTGFIQFQYENKSREINIYAAPVKTALLAINSYGFLNEALNKGYVRLEQELHKKYATLNDNCLTLIQDIKEGCITPKDKDKDKDKKGDARGKQKNPVKGERFTDDFKKVIMSDGTEQELGADQKELAKSGKIKPYSILEGSKY